MGLNDYSIRFADRLFREFPDLRSLLVERPEDDGCFTIEMESPTGIPLWIRTEVNPMLTVGFGPYHTHFGGWRESVDEEDFDRAVGYVRGILSGEYVILVRSWADGACRTDILHKTAIPQPDSGCRFTLKAWTDTPTTRAEPVAPLTGGHDGSTITTAFRPAGR